MKVLLIRPTFPESRNSVFRIPIGLCKISSWKKDIGDTVYYSEGLSVDGNIPYHEIEEVYITSMFTYWSQYVIDAINFYKNLCPNTKIIAGGIYASIAPEHLKEHSSVDEIIVGVHHIAENYNPDYSILPTDNEKINNAQIIWASRGCRRRCDWCFVWKLEPEIVFFSLDEVEKFLIQNPDRKNILLYDNSILQYPDIEQLLQLFIKYHKLYKYKYNCTQGIDGRMLKTWEEKGIPVAQLMKQAGFYDLRFSYDHSGQKDSVYYCIDKFEQAGYKRKEMQIFCIINNEESPESIERRYFEIYKLGCQIHSDRFRPSDRFYDNYNGAKKPQSNEDYFINSKHGWTDSNIKGMFRLMSDINYANRMGCLLVEADDMQKGKILNKGKSSKKLLEYLD